MDFRDYLNSELLQRCEKNPRYSLRAFARSLGVESSYLSKVLRKKRPSSVELIERLSPMLTLEPREVYAYKAALGISDKKRVPRGNAIAFNPLDLDTFHLICDWYHYAILELARMDHFRSDVRWIAEELSIPVPVARDAIDRLVRLDLLKRNTKGLLVSQKNSTTTKNPNTAAAFRKLQRDILSRAMTVMEEVPFEDRDQSSITMAVDISLLPEAKQRIKKFRRQLMRFLQGGNKKNAVYQLSVSLYPVTRVENVKRGKVS